MVQPQTPEALDPPGGPTGKLQYPFQGNAAPPWQWKQPSPLEMPVVDKEDILQLPRHQSLIKS